MKKLVGVIDVGIGNIFSIQRMVEKVGGGSELIQKPSQLLKFKKIILPGVGHFGEGMRALNGKGFSKILINLVIQKKVQILGICLGMQLLCRSSEESNISGLGLIDAEVRKLHFSVESKLKVPHMGWNVVSASRVNPLLPVSTEEVRFYFVHSYKVVPKDPAITIGTTNYGGEFCAALQQGNMFGVQFHPEKSHRFGMALMSRFIEL
jgi:glutamine amidotransferase